MLNDRRHNQAGHTIHNHFIVKALHLTRPGGLVALLTSRYTMDAQNPAARREMASLADVVGALRLPSSAHQRAAGTGIVTDLLLVRRREHGRPPRDIPWEQARPLVVPGGQVVVNQYFHRHPERVLGELRVGRGAYGPEELVVTADRPLATTLAQALRRVVEEARHAHLTISPRSAKSPPRPVTAVGPRSHQPDGFLEAHADGRFTCTVDGEPLPHPPPNSQAAELRHLLGLRDTVVALLETEAASIDDSPEIDDLRRQLNHRYETYVARFGPINRFTWRPTAQTHHESGEMRLARIRPPQGGFRVDPFANLVCALEHFDPLDQRATKADIFRQRVIAPRVPRLGADTAADALSICLDTHGEVRLEEIARLLGIDQAAARSALGMLVFGEPGTERLVPVAE